MEERKICLKNKKCDADYLGKDLYSRTTIQILDLGRQGQLSFSFP